MAEIKAHEFDGALNRIIRDFAVFLVHGPTRAWSTSAPGTGPKSGVALDDPFSVVRLEAGDLAQDVARLADETRSMVCSAARGWSGCAARAAKSPSFDAVVPSCPNRLPIALWSSRAGDIKKGAGLRKVVEPAKGAVAIPCYADDERSLNVLIDQELAAAGLGISADARQQLLTILSAATGWPAATRSANSRSTRLARAASSCTMSTRSSAMPAPFPPTRPWMRSLSGDDAAFVHGHAESDRVEDAGLSHPAGLHAAIADDRHDAGGDGRNGCFAAAGHGDHGRGLHFKRKPVIERALAHWQHPRLPAS